MHKDDSNHQKQVEELTDKTADSLDDLALKILFVSLQQNNLELCITYAIQYAPNLGSSVKMEKVVEACMLWFSHSYIWVSTRLTE
ncbi:hypothetical protein BYT27DRAFT_6709813 [Phlegmacium glaucopus]|nr:hypothetical protein BYT27DRAFT_6709813 [Phlegmacium glaucopus]